VGNIGSSIDQVGPLLPLPIWAKLPVYSNLCCPSDSCSTS